VKLADINPAGYAPGADATEIVAEAVSAACKRGAKDKVIELSAFDDADGLPIIKSYNNASGPIRFTAGGVTIRGPSRKSSGFQLDPASYTGPGAYSVFHTNDQPWLTFERFRLDGQRTAVKLPSTISIANSMIYVSSGSVNARIAQMVVHGVFNGVGESFPLMLMGAQGAVDDSDIYDVIGTGVHVLGRDSRVSRNRIAGCTWNSISIYSAVDPICDGNICRSAGKRNINLELSQGVLVHGNHCVGARYGNIGTYHGVTKTFIGGNYCENANGGNFQLGEIDIADADADVEIAANALHPHANGWHVSRSTAAKIAIADPLWSTYRIFEHA
jgi:hypothetical protein